MDVIYNLSVILILCFAVVVFFLLFHISAPYGKFSREGWGPSIRSKWAWMIMELPSPVLMAYLFLTSDQRNLPAFIFILLWLIHYIHRASIYPFIQSGGNKSYPVLLVFMALVFNCLNGFVNGYGVFHLNSYDFSWLYSWQMMSGGVIFISGFVINKAADEKLRKFRIQAREEYVLPRGWLFKYISSPHYFGEIIEWCGWGIMTWSIPGLAFFIFTFANLFPRAIASHNWYNSKFSDYPSNRKAIIPFII